MCIAFFSNCLFVEDVGYIILPFLRWGIHWLSMRTLDNPQSDCLTPRSLFWPGGSYVALSQLYQEATPMGIVGLMCGTTPQLIIPINGWMGRGALYVGWPGHSLPLSLLAPRVSPVLVAWPQSLLGRMWVVVFRGWWYPLPFLHQFSGCGSIWGGWKGG